MYSSSRKYPEFKGLSSREQSAIVKAAILADPSAQKRLVLAICAVLFLGVAGNFVSDWVGLTESQVGLIQLLLVGAGVYAYLLWEINSGIRGAVLRYLAEHPVSNHQV